MKRIVNSTLVISLFFATFILASFTPPDGNEPKPWDIPEKYKKLDNPYGEYTKDMQRLGRMLWSKHCKSCHGSNGEGDGPKARQLETDAGDFTTKEFQQQSDGVLYYKSIIGRDEMPNYEKKLPDEEERWALIMYMRQMDE